jgi:hypothetical protein
MRSYRSDAWVVGREGFLKLSKVEFHNEKAAMNE